MICIPHLQTEQFVRESETARRKHLPQPPNPYYEDGYFLKKGEAVCRLGGGPSEEFDDIERGGERLTRFGSGVKIKKDEKKEEEEDAE